MESRKLNRLVDLLRNPDAYDHPVREVEVVETHISVVLLAGSYAYKIKKPVDFGFVDFTTLEKRRRFCEEELRLNRRFAPELYLGVVGIHEDGNGASFHGGGPAVEYAVKMARFDDNALLDRCIRDEALVTGRMVEELAVDVAAVHADAGVAVPGDGYGTPSVIAANVSECRDPIRDAGLIGQTSALLDGMDARTATLVPWFEKRLREGRVRECHGDMHLGNLFLQRGRITAFDCIEFNPALRWIDVANEIAFVTMDLRHHSKTGFARRFRNAYLDATGDYPALRVLRYYEIYRALVRAKVASLREAEQAGAGISDARAHLALAHRLADEAPGAGVIITCGLSGSGKTYMTSGLLEACEAIRIRSDIERDRSARNSEARYSETGIELVYQRLLEQAEEVVAAGYPVIVDATFLKHERRERFRQLAARLGVPFRILHCTAPEEELRRRIDRRARQGTDASEADTTVLDLQLRELEPFLASEAGDVVTSDARSPLSVAGLLSKLGLAGA